MTNDLAYSAGASIGQKVRLLKPMFVDRKVRYSAMFTNLVRWHVGAVSFPLSDVFLAQLACPLNDVIFYLHSGITNLSLYKHWLNQLWVKRVL